jgi:hypothetical protein
LIALQRRDRRVGALLEAAARDRIEVGTCTTCVAQAWRDPARQALLSRALAGFVEHPLDSSRARRIGLLLARCETSDVVDAAVVTLARDGDALVTSDAADLTRLAAAADVKVRVLAI